MKGKTAMLVKQIDILAIFLNHYLQRYLRSLWFCTLFFRWCFRWWFCIDHRSRTISFHTTEPIKCRCSNRQRQLLNIISHIILNSVSRTTQDLLYQKKIYAFNSATTLDIQCTVRFIVTEVNQSIPAKYDSEVALSLLRVETHVDLTVPSVVQRARCLGIIIVQEVNTKLDKLLDYKVEKPVKSPLIKGKPTCYSTQKEF